MDGSCPRWPMQAQGEGLGEDGAAMWVVVSAPAGRHIVKRSCQDRYLGFPTALAAGLPATRRRGSRRTLRRVPIGAERSADQRRFPLATLAAADGGVPGRNRMSGKRNLRLQGCPGRTKTAERAEVQGDQDLPRHIGSRGRVDSADRWSVSPHMVAASLVRHHRKLRGGLE